MNAAALNLGMRRDPFAGLDPKLVKTTQKWLAQTFFGTLLKQMRESPFRSDLFDGGRGGQAFGSLYDQRLVERLGNGASTKLVRAIVKKIEAKRAYEKSNPVRRIESVSTENASNAPRAK
jgi:Rod binding domain-containing protein